MVSGSFVKCWLMMLGEDSSWFWGGHAYCSFGFCALGRRFSPEFALVLLLHGDVNVTRSSKIFVVFTLWNYL